mgnify:CR=1 FL=1
MDEETLDQTLEILGAHTLEITNDNRAFGSLFAVSTVMGGVYWRDSLGGLRLNASAIDTYGGRPAAQVR